MKTRLLTLIISISMLSSCSQFKIKSAQNENHPCYSTWHHYPHNG